MDETPSSVPFGREWLAAIAAFVIHNGEEVLLDLPAWAAVHSPAPWITWAEQPGRFEITVVGISVAVCALALFASTRGRAWNRWALGIFAGVMLANVASHVVLSVMSGTLMPGVVSAIVLVAPAMAWVLWRVR